MRRLDLRLATSSLLTPIVAGICLGCSEPPGYGLTNVSQDLHAAWSPDGQRIAFQHSGGIEAPGLYLAGIDGTARHLIVPDGHSPDWSPDGSALALGVGFSYQVFRFDLMRDSLVPLTNAGLNVDPAWSPDGRIIAYDSDGNQGNTTSIWLMDANGAQVRRVPIGSESRDALGEADWAPDGSHLVASAVWILSATSFVHRLLVFDTTGHDTTWITPPTFEVRQPAWSPTGEWIAYQQTSGNGNEFDIRILHPDGTGDRLLARRAFHPAWSPDGKRIAFSRFDGKTTAVWSVDLTGNNLEQLTWPAR